MLLLTTSVFAQAPQGMSYQAVVRDASQNLVAGQAVGTQVRIIQGSVSGGAVYVETHTLNTNINGLLTLEIGSGTVVAGDFATIDWANGPYYIKTETDPAGGSNYTIIATSQMMSVPYALYAASSGSSIPGPQGVPGNPGPQGPSGVDGIDGLDGESAYELWLNAGNTGTEADFLASLQGVQGLEGESAYGTWLSLGNTGGTIDFLASLQGATGAQGPMGLTGSAGADGVDGIDGIDGAVGPQGPMGLTGSAGAIGTTGPQGPMGLTGPAGADGVDGIDGAVGPQGPAGTYTAGTGIDITGGVISATAVVTSPEYAYLSIGNSSTTGAQALSVQSPSATYLNGIVTSGTDFTLSAGVMYEVTAHFYIYNASGAHSYVMKDVTNSTVLGTEMYFGQSGADISYNTTTTNFLIKPTTDINVELQKTSGTAVNLIGKIVVKEIK